MVTNKTWKKKYIFIKYTVVVNNVLVKRMSKYICIYVNKKKNKNLFGCFRKEKKKVMAIKQLQCFSIYVMHALWIYLRCSPIQHLRRWQVVHLIGLIPDSFQYWNFGRWIFSLDDCCNIEAHSLFRSCNRMYLLKIYYYWKLWKKEKKKKKRR